MKVRIIKASRPTYWYAKHIGEVHLVSKIKTSDGDKYATLDRGIASWLINPADCEIVPEAANDRE